MRKLVAVLAGIGLLIAASSAMALTFNENRPFTPLESNEAPLSDVLSQNFDKTLTQSSAAIWSHTEFDTTSYRVAFLSGHDGTLYLYSYADPSISAALLNTSGLPVSTSFMIDGGTLYIGMDSYSGFGNLFGFYWQDNTENYKAYTEDSLNVGTGYGDDSNIRALTYQVKAGTNVTIAGGSGSITKPAQGNDDWVIAFEDHPLGIGDGDFQDAVFYIEDMAPVPEPGTVLLLGAGLLGLGFYGRRRMKKA